MTDGHYGLDSVRPDSCVQRCTRRRGWPAHGQKQRDNLVTTGLIQTYNVRSGGYPFSSQFIRARETQYRKIIGGAGHENWSVDGRGRLSWTECGDSSGGAQGQLSLRRWVRGIYGGLAR